MPEDDALEVVFDADSIVAYGGTGVGIHSDIEAAADAGFDGLVSWGTLTMLPFWTLLERLCGPNSRGGVRLKVELKKPVLAGDAVRYSARRLSGSPGRAAFELEATTDRFGIVAAASATLPEQERGPATSADIETSGGDANGLLSTMARSTRGAHIVGRPVPMLKRIVKPPLTWDAAVPGLEFPALEYAITATDVAWFLRMAERLGLRGSGEHPCAVPAGFFADEPMQCINTLFGRSGRLHAAHWMETCCRIPIGGTVRSRASITHRCEKAGRKFIDVLCSVHLVSEAGETEAIRIGATLVP